jgi:hypothetical protein
MNNKRVKIEPTDPTRPAMLTMFTNPAALLSWIRNGRGSYASGEETFHVYVDATDSAHAEKIGYELVWNADGSYERLNCVTIVKSTIVLGSGITMKAYVGWIDDDALRFDLLTSNAANTTVRITDNNAVASEHTGTSGPMSIEAAFAAALKNVDQAVGAENAKMWGPPGAAS